MANHPDYPPRPRIVVDVTEEQQKALKRLLPWGVQNELFRQIIDDLISVLEQHGGMALGLILTQQLKFREFSTVLRDLPNNDQEKPDGNDP